MDSSETIKIALHGKRKCCKIQYMECRMSGQPYKFVLQLTGYQFMYQVLEFKDMNQFHQFCQANTGNKGEPFIQVGSRMIALRLSCCFQKFELRQDKVDELTKYITKPHAKQQNGMTVF